MTAAVGWAVVGPDGVESWTVTPRREWTEFRAKADGGLKPGCRLARVRIEVIEEGDAARGENDGR